MATLLTRAAGSTWVRLLITVGILAYLASDIDMGEAARAVIAVRPGYLAAVLGLVAVDRMVMILRWILLLRASGVAIEASRAAALFLVSSFVGSFLPSGIGGDAARAYGLSRSNATGSEALASVVVDRLLGIVSLALMGAVGLLAWRPGGTLVWEAAALALVIFTGSIALFWTDVIVRRVLPASWRSKGVFRGIAGAGEAVGRYRARGATLAHVLLWSIVVQLLRIVQAYLLGLGLGITAPFSAYLLFMPLGLFMLLLPISVSGFGLPQGVFVWMLQPLGVPDVQSLALSTLIILTGLAGNLPGLLLWLRRV